MAFERKTDCEYSDGVIVEITRGREYRVLLDGGGEVTAVLPKAFLRQSGIVGRLAGWRCTVVHLDASRPPRIVDLVRPDSGGTG